MITSTTRSVPLLIVAALALAGCGGGDDGGDSGSGGGASTAKGKELFTKTCGSCHTLSDAGTSGTFGPELDGMGLDAERVSQQIETGGGGMPEGLLTGADRDAVADYVAQASK